MKTILVTFALVALTTACSSTNHVANKPVTTPQHPINPTGSLPTKEIAFVKAIEKLDRKAIVAQLGEPAKADDVRIKGTNKIVASIWHYHYINTSEEGEYYKTTELDFIKNKVVQVVFLNNNGSEQEENSVQSYVLPKNKPDQ